jgi:hypothetical protein
MNPPYLSLKYCTVLFPALCCLPFCQQKKVEDFRLLLSFRCESFSYISLDKHLLTVVDNLRRDYMDEPEEDFYVYNRYEYDGQKDSLLKKRNISGLNPLLFRDTLQKMHRGVISIDSLDGYHFLYDSIPSELAKKYNPVENPIYNFRKYKNWWIYTTREYNHNSALEMLNVAEAGKQQIIKTEMPGMLGFGSPDFLLFDITGDGKPEIFLFAYGYMMNRYHFDAAVYRVW